MNDFAERYFDKSAWLRGPWDDEPDVLYWEGEGQCCLIQRSDFTGSLCGYVAVTPSHSLYGAEIPVPRLSVHGGITFTGHIELDEIPGSQALWWLAFDCGHAFDSKPAFAALPGMRKLTRSLGAHETYRDLNYVTAEVQRLARQLADYGKEEGTGYGIVH